MFAFIGLAACYLVQPHEEKGFVSWMRQQSQVYTGDEYHLRFAIYLATTRLISSHNKAGKGFRLTANRFAALTAPEYKALLGHRSSSTIAPRPLNGKVLRDDPPDAFDWRDKGIVNPIKDQGQCGSCWAFSIIQAQESQWALKKTDLLSLSEQNIVDCVDTCYGCDGGDEYLAYDYVIKYQNGFYNLESDYPYKAYDQNCKFDASKGVAPTASYFRPTTTKNETELLVHLYNDGVVSVAIDASSYAFQLYSGGVYNQPSCSQTDLDHAVGLIGYGTDGSTPYWLVRNSWGTSWGEKGYIRMSRNKNNQCGIATDVIIPQITA
jgi:cathepsin L